MNPIDPNEAPEGYVAVAYDSSNRPTCWSCAFFRREEAWRCLLDLGFSCFAGYRADRRNVIFMKSRRQVDEGNKINEF